MLWKLWKLCLFICDNCTALYWWIFIWSIRRLYIHMLWARECVSCLKEISGCTHTYILNRTSYKSNKRKLNNLALHNKIHARALMQLFGYYLDYTRRNHHFDTKTNRCFPQRVFVCTYTYISYVCFWFPLKNFEAWPTRELTRFNENVIILCFVSIYGSCLASIRSIYAYTSYITSARNITQTCSEGVGGEKQLGTKLHIYIH